MAALKFGPLELQTPVLSAPIAGFTDSIYRRTVRDLGGCGLLFTEMVWAGGWVQGKIDPDRLDGVVEEERPLGVQLWDREPEFIEEGARRLADMGVSLIDLNFGCPKRRIMGRHAAGATLLRDPATVGKLVAAAVRGAGNVPVTAKIRLGPSLTARTAPEVARSIEDNGAVGVTVHGRTADQHYGDPCHLDLIREVVQAVSIPVIANGDVRDAASAVGTLDATGAAGVMVARAALTRPWVFREIAAALNGAPVPPAPTARQQKALLLKHHAALVEREGDPRGTILMRKFACRYIAGAPGTHAFRDAVTRAKDSADFGEIVERLFPLDDGWPTEHVEQPLLAEAGCA
jgi:tRNA-dihydrouridine synthase B